MPHFLQVFFVAVVVAFLTGCGGDIHHEAQQVPVSVRPTVAAQQVVPRTTPTTALVTTTTESPGRRLIDRTRWLQEVARQQVAATVRPRSTRTVATVTAPPVAATPSQGSSCQYAGLIRSIWTRDADWAIWVISKRGGFGESNCEPGVHTSSSWGLFEMQLPLHNDQFIAVGCSPSQWADPTCNIKAAWHLYQGAGRGPWGL